MVAKRQGGRPMMQQPYDTGTSEGGRQDPFITEILKEFSVEDPYFMRAMIEIDRLKRVHRLDLRTETAKRIIRETIERYREWDARDDARRAQKTHGELVYYMRLGNRVKIGWTTNLKARRDAIQPEEVMVTEKGGQKVEFGRHKQFAELRVSGEWFRLEEPLISHIAKLQRPVKRSVA